MGLMTLVKLSSADLEASNCDVHQLETTITAR
jgi:hypothetical protein